MSSRSIVISTLDALLDQFNDGFLYSDESRYQEVSCLLQSVDWGLVPIDIIRDVFHVIVSRTPEKVLAIAPQRRNLLNEARDSLKTNAQLRKEAAAESDGEPTWYGTLDIGGAS